MTRLIAWVRVIPAYLWAGVVWLWKLLWGDKVPLIANIGLILLTAWITYSVAPKINGQFERQKIQSSYVLENLRSINGLVSDLYVEITYINYEVAANRPPPPERVAKAREIIGKLNWKLIETAAVLERESDWRLLREFQERTSQVRGSLDRVSDRQSAEQLLKDTNLMATAAVKVIAAVGKRASLDPDAEPGA